jgi:excisionase family DNA binding protein
LLPIKIKHTEPNLIKPKKSEIRHPMEKSKDEVLTTDEATRFLKISRPTYFKCIRLGKINAIKVGSAWRVLQSELYKFLKSGKGRSKGENDLA